MRGISAIIDHVEETYKSKPIAAQQAINYVHEYIVSKNTTPPNTWPEKDREMYESHVGECPPCFAGAFLAAARRRLEEKDIEIMVEQLRLGNNI